MTYTVKFNTYAGEVTEILGDHEAHGNYDAVVKASIKLTASTGVSLPEDAGFKSVSWESDQTEEEMEAEIAADLAEELCQPWPEGATEAMGPGERAMFS